MKTIYNPTVCYYGTITPVGLGIDWNKTTPPVGYFEVLNATVRFRRGGFKRTREFIITGQRLWYKSQTVGYFTTVGGVLQSAQLEEVQTGLIILSESNQVILYGKLHEKFDNPYMKAIIGRMMGAAAKVKAGTLENNTVEENEPFLGA